MRENRVKTIWKNGGIVLAGGVNLDSPYLAELIAHQGFDAIIVDTQHAPLDYKGMLANLQAISTTPAIPIVRVGWNHPPLIMQVLDAGAYGVICPMVNSRADCEAFVSACYYAPKGYRSWGPIRGTLYGGPDYFERANDTILPMIQIETIQAVERLDEILSVPGLGGIYFGPGDMSITLGLHPQKSYGDPKLLEVVEKTMKACRKHNVLAGIMTPNAQFAKQAIGWGAQLVTPGSDIGFVRTGAQTALAEFRSFAPAT